MITHHLQKSIIRKLGGFEKAHFSDIQLGKVEGNIFTYHLQQLVKQDYIQKDEAGLYSVTAKGKNYLVKSGRPSHESPTEAHSVLLLVVSRNDEWLVRKHLMQPNLGLYGFVHGEPQPDEGVTVTAAKRLEQKTGLQANFVVRASGLIRIYKNNELESFSHCVVLHAENPTGNLLPGDSTGENHWVSAKAFSETHYLPSVPALHELILTASGTTFFDKTYQL